MGAVNSSLMSGAAATAALAVWKSLPWLLICSLSVCVAVLVFCVLLPFFDTHIREQTDVGDSGIIDQNVQMIQGSK